MEHLLPRIDIHHGSFVKKIEAIPCNIKKSGSEETDNGFQDFLSESSMLTFFLIK
jgi:hypothetical protein